MNISTDTVTAALNTYSNRRAALPGFARFQRRATPGAIAFELGFGFDDGRDAFWTAVDSIKAILSELGSAVLMGDGGWQLAE